MEHLPLETLQQIFRLACTDGGYTGCSLALTSKSIREAAQSTRFHSIALAAETERLVALVTLYQDQCSNAASLRPRISHLHLSFPKLANTNTRPSDDPVEEDEDWDEEIEDDDDDDEASSSPLGSLIAARITAAQQFLSLVADDLHSLVITEANAVPLFDRAFPSLRELTLLRYADPSKLTAPNSKILPLFPALTHLHIVTPNWSRPLLPSWIAHAPRVTHLRISAHSLFGLFVDELPDAIGTPAYPFKRGFRLGAVVGPPPALRTYPTLVRLVVQPGPRPSSGPCGTNRLVFSSRTAQLEWIAARAKTAGVEMYVLSPCSWTEREWDEAIYREWGRRTGGEASRDWFSGVDSEDADADQDATH
ncbi:hypothetical protein LXA43DRAFT_955830 [Ganoderma leucocontextum]|nr:hypothetical protein LXA43DRAFT_955830 [Ganoderma leucocontextum]